MPSAIQAGEATLVRLMLKSGTEEPIGLPTVRWKPSHLVTNEVGKVDESVIIAKADPRTTVDSTSSTVVELQSIMC